MLNLIEDLRKSNAAKDKRIEFLEKRLAQRFESTVQDYASRLKHFESMQRRVLQFFHEDVPAGVGLTHEDIRREFSRKFPRVPTSNLDRRVQELAQAGKLWRSQDDGVVRFYLRLVEAPQMKRLDNTKKELSQ